MIKTEGLSVRLGKKEILKNASILAPDGEITVILGKNGSGKTTLLSSVFSTRGGTNAKKIYIDGKPLADISGKELARAVSLMPQTLPLPSMSVRELVSLGRAPYTGAFGKLSEKDRETVGTAILALGLEHLADASVTSLSGGERQSAFFAMLLAKDAHNILLDEPASALDPSSRIRLFSFVREQRALGKCILLVMHDLTDAVSLADRIYVIDGGVTGHPMTRDEFISSGIPERLFASSAYTVKTEKGERTVFHHIE